MNLPNQSQPNLPTPVKPVPPVQSSRSYSGKEMEMMGSPEPILPIVDIGKEIDLPKEVVTAGVSQKPITVQIPQPLIQTGVQPSGNNVNIGNGSQVTLPLTDDKIQTGLHQGASYSIRWLAEWCIRQLKVVKQSFRKPERAKP